ncbi:MAG: DUF4956 domain-containing protein [Ruminococcaceae bacterium]|nr:DUF4956 domain-containing protein [Oscillospiraceae bacterium]
MSFKDIFSNSFISGYMSHVDAKTILARLCVTVFLSLFVFFIYRVITRKTFYSKTFNISLVAMAVITAAIILAIQSNIVLSLGMVGALSIVRFRTAVKDPLDLVFLYWAISLGIICGAGLSMVAVVLSLTMAVIVVFLQMYPVKKASMILVVNSTSLDSDKKILDVVKSFSKSYKIKSKNLTRTTLDIIVEVNVADESELLSEVMKLDGVTMASLLSHDGEITAA